MAFVERKFVHIRVEQWLGEDSGSNINAFAGLRQNFFQGVSVDTVVVHCDEGLVCSTVVEGRILAIQADKEEDSFVLLVVLYRNKTLLWKDDAMVCDMTRRTVLVK
jgi:hypothetical protein